MALRFIVAIFTDRCKELLWWLCVSRNKENLNGIQVVFHGNRRYEYYLRIKQNITWVISPTCMLVCT